MQALAVRALARRPLPAAAPARGRAGAAPSPARQALGAAARPGDAALPSRHAAGLSGAPAARRTPHARRGLDRRLRAGVEARGASAAISQHELVQLLSSLLRARPAADARSSPDADEVFERYRRQRRARTQAELASTRMSIKLPLLYPDAWFERRARLGARRSSRRRCCCCGWRSSLPPACSAGSTGSD